MFFKVKKIQPSSYAEFQNHQFGKQHVTCLQLCSMFKRKDKTGYYQVEHVSPLHCKFLYGKTEIVLQLNWILPYTCICICGCDDNVAGLVNLTPPPHTHVISVHNINLCDKVVQWFTEILWLSYKYSYLPHSKCSLPLRERPFNLKGGGYGFFLKKIFWFPMLLKKIFWFWWRKKKIIWFRVFVI